MFSRENTRNRISFVVVILTVIYLFSHQSLILDFLYELEYGKLVIPIFVSILSFVGFFWIIARKIDSEMLSTVVSFPSISIFIVTSFLELIIFDQTRVGRITMILNFSLLFFFTMSILMLTANILLTSYQKDIPLGQAGRATSYIISIITQYLAFFILFSGNVDIFLRYSIILMMLVYYSYFLVWTLKISHLETIVSSLVISFLVLLFSIILGFWPLGPEIISLVLAITLYICLGISLEMKEVVSKYIWIEYGLLIIGIIGLIFLSGDWGINGPIF